MVWKRQVLVVANVTATSAELVGALTDQAARQPVAFTLVVPATPLPGGRDAAGEQLDGAVAQLRELGLDVDGRVGDVDPMVAVLESWDPRQYDEIIVSTLPTGTSKWLHATSRAGCSGRPARWSPTWSRVPRSSRRGWRRSATATSSA